MAMIMGVTASLLLWVPPIWRLRRVMAPVSMVMMAVAAVLTFVITHKALSLLILYFQLLSMFNIMRVSKERMHPRYLYKATLRTSLVLLLLQFLSYVLLIASINLDWTPEHWFLGASVVLLAIQLFLTTSLGRHLKAVNKVYKGGHFTDHELPTVTVAIPARNETEDLESCLHSLIESNYPKLEIIVLDDCSQQPRTPEIIRAFAHDGVRFLAGKPAPEDWLAKNYAYQQLLDAASGDYILFCGVDVRFSSQTIRELVEQVLVRNKLMISVMPINSRPRPFQLESLIAQPLRYAWELMLPRRRFASPSVLSTCWIANSGFIQKSGGFAAVSRMIHPEAYLAKLAAKHNDCYSFIASSSELGLFCNKSLAEQRSTFIRTRYPQLHKRPEAVGIQALTHLFVNFSPLLLVLTSTIMEWWLVAAIAFLTTALALYNYSRVVNQTYRQNYLVSYIVQPLAILYDVGMVHYSMWRYEFRDVIWKDRNVCVPVMHVEPHLPTLP